MVVLKELMVALIANEDAFGECGKSPSAFNIKNSSLLMLTSSHFTLGYYLATFEAALQHIYDLASQYEDIAKGDGSSHDREDISDYKD